MPKAKATTPPRILNAFEAFKAGMPLSEGMSKAFKKIESRNPVGKVNLDPREFTVYARAADASKVAKVSSADDVSRATARARP